MKHDFIDLLLDAASCMLQFCTERNQSAISPRASIFAAALVLSQICSPEALSTRKWYVTANELLRQK
jgi:hypothetical protein